MHHTILITGATGNIGGRILKDLIESTNAHCKLLVYGSDDLAARSDVERSFTFWNTSITPDIFAERIEIVRGDMSHPTLSLDTDTYNRIGTEITHTIHCAANIKLNQTINEARGSILEGTRHIVDICRLSMKNGTFKRFNHFSTMEVTGTMSGIAQEEFLTDIRRSYLNTYEQAKAEAEEYLRELHEKEGFPITIYRPSMVVGDAENGKITTFGSFYHMIDDLFLNPQSPIMPGHDKFIIDTIPINMIAKAVTLLHDADESNGRVYQLTSGMDQTLTLPQFSQELQKVLKKLTGKDFTPPRFMSPRLIWILNMIAYPFTFGKLKRRIMINLIFLKFFFLRIRFDNRETKAFLAKHNVSIPPLSSYLETLVQYYLAHHTKAPLTK